jgi:hypothetical protein
MKGRNEGWPHSDENSYVGKNMGMERLSKWNNTADLGPGNILK